VPSSNPARDALYAQIRASHPRLREALIADARVTLFHRGEGREFSSRLDVAVQVLRLAWCSDAFLAQALYRVKARTQALGIPIVPRVAHRLAMALAQISIGDPVVVEPGVYIIHGPVRIGAGAQIGANAVVVDDVEPGRTVVGAPARPV
jgi:serine acetyltransferase